MRTKDKKDVLNYHKLSHKGKKKQMQKALHLF